MTRAEPREEQRAALRAAGILDLASLGTASAVGPIQAASVAPSVMQEALRLAGGDAGRLVILARGRVDVWPTREEADAARARL